MLSDDEIAFFQAQGYLTVSNLIGGSALKTLQTDFSNWVEESRQHSTSYGTTINDRPRFDLEPDHERDWPALRRVNAPVEVSQTYFDVMRDSAMTDCIADLIGPNVKFHHSKINSKRPGGHTKVKWHQDFMFTPHTNDDVITALFMVDDVTEENGPLEVLPGSHQGELHNLWHDGKFTGSVSDTLEQKCRSNSQLCLGPAGSVCFMHTRLLHGSRPNLSKTPRTMFISVYSSDDAVPVSPNPMPSKYEGMLVRGERTGQVRSSAYHMMMPELPQTASFFDQQAIHREI